MTTARIAALNVYPVKSCRGIACERAQVNVRGLSIADAGDREWMIVDCAGRFVTQREHPRLALVGTAVEAGHLTLNAPGLGSIVVSTAASGERHPGRRRLAQHRPRP